MPGLWARIAQLCSNEKARTVSSVTVADHSLEPDDPLRKNPSKGRAKTPILDKNKSAKDIRMERARSDVLDPKLVLELKRRLDAAGIDTSKYGQGNEKSLEELYYEISVLRDCELATLPDGSLQRIVSVVKIRLLALDMFGNSKCVYSKQQIKNANDKSRLKTRRDFLSRKIRPGESLQQAVGQALGNRLGLKGTLQNHIQLAYESKAYSEKEVPSPGYPGLKGLYKIHEVDARVMDPQHPDLKCIGLPEGLDFAVMGEAASTHEFVTTLRMWTWAAPPENLTFENFQADKNSLQKRQSRVDDRPRLRAPVPDGPLTHGQPVSKIPNAELCSLMADKKTDWKRIQNCAARIREPDYGLREFFDDMEAGFPELKLYLAAESTTSGRTGDDEYQRTIGALFAIYFLMRIDIDGREGFVFGCDETADGLWIPRAPPDENDELLDKDKKRLNFYTKTDWAWITQLFVNSGILLRSGQTLAVCQERFIAMLALTAIHDIMKVEILCPSVCEAHAPFRDYRAGDKIGDHDVALGYVLEKFPHLLPSFAGLEPAQRKAVEFTQSKMEYNQGWLVQGEAPPGRLFSNFKTLLTSGGVEACNVSFYFVHWLTDLAGAEPYPLEGSEKFVLKFPHAVLVAFLKSFPVVQSLADATETEVYEKYLGTRWSEANMTQPVGSEESIAKMRLVCMSQAHAVKVCEAFDSLADEEKRVLSREMARTGCEGQMYSLYEPAHGGQDEAPAILVYYGPAMMQKFGKDEPVKALKRLCEVYKQATMLWPPSPNSAGENVTVRIDTIKDKSHDELRESMASGDVFMLVKHNDKEAFVEAHNMSSLNEMMEAEDLGDFRFLQLT